MAEMTRIEYAEYDERMVVGMMKRTTFEKAGQECWGAAFQNGTFDKLKEIDEWVCPDQDPYIGLGHMSKFEGQNNFQYIIGKFVKTAASLPDGLYSENIPAGTVARIWIESDTLDNIIACAYMLCKEAIEKTGYEIDFRHFYWCDIYTYKRYCEPQEKGERIILDYILPVIKK